METSNIRASCLFDSRDRENHFTKKKWPERISLKPGSSNVIKPLLVDETKIFIPPLHLKLCLMKQFVRALDKDGNCFKYVAQKMSKVSEAKLEAGIFDGPQIRTLFNNMIFTKEMINEEKAAWTCFRKVSQNFLGNHKSPDYKKLISDEQISEIRMQHEH